MIIYLAGGVSGNLNPAWGRMAKTEISPDGLLKGLIDEGFFGREHDISSLYRSDTIRGGL